MSFQHFDEFSVEQCPMLIGIMRRSSEEKGWSLVSDYQFTSLLKGETIPVNIISLTLQSIEYQVNFPNLIFLSFRYDNEVSFELLS